MIRLDEIAGQDPAVDLLRRAIRTGRLPHALLFQGPDSVGKGTTARAVAIHWSGVSFPGNRASCTRSDSTSTPPPGQEPSPASSRSSSTASSGFFPIRDNHSISIMV